MRPAQAVFRTAIDLALAGGALLGAPLIAWKLLRRPRWRAGFASRLALTLPPREASGGLWLHAVSAGELLAAEPLVRHLQAILPDVPPVLSVTTEAAHRLASERLAGIPRFFWPLDFSPIVSRVLNHVRPRLVALIELELWPNFLMACAQRGIPTVVVNGRITERCARHWGRVRPLARRVFGWITHFAVQNEEYADRLRDLGVGSERISVCGNLKFDVPRDASIAAAPVRDQLGLAPERPLLVAGCTHPGEEALLVAMLPALGNPGLVLAPRHIERVPEVARIVREAGLTPCSLRDGTSGQVLVVDVFGRLEALYRAADVVVVGGTFVPHGGHNMLEPARWGLPVVFGPSIDNFRDVALGLLARKAAVQVRSADDLAAVLRRLLASREERAALGREALAAWRQGKGAVLRYGEIITNLLRKENVRDG